MNDLGGVRIKPSTYNDKTTYRYVGNVDFDIKTFFAVMLLLCHYVRMSTLQTERHKIFLTPLCLCRCVGSVN